MENRQLSQAALDTIDAYKRVRVGTADAPVPYFNNRTRGSRMALRAYVGKGSPKDIQGELEGFLVKHHIVRETVTSEVLSKALADAGLGIDCSGFAYYILDAESRARGLGRLSAHLSFIQAHLPFKFVARLRAAENCGVKTFASDINSRPIGLTDARPGDFISFLGNTAQTNDKRPQPDRDHILVITSIEAENGVVKKINYAHAIAYPEDGLYGTGIKEGSIDVANPDAGLLGQTWSEGGLFNDGAKYIFNRAQNSKTELRRLKWF